MRFIHTADVHLDACFASSGMPVRIANRRRHSLRDVLHRILRRAVEWPADAVLIAGDLFDHERVTRDTIEFLRKEFEALGDIPVFIAPGNHDPFMPGSPYLSESWPGNVFIFSKPEWASYTLRNDSLAVHGFAFDGFDISSNPFGTLRVPDDGALHIAVGHGSERAHQPPDGKSYAPFDAAASAVPGLAYLALGHFHRVTEIQAGDLPTVMYYPGAPEGHGFDETGPRHYLEVEIEEGRARVTPVASADVVYATYELDCSDLVSSHDVIEWIRLRAAETVTPQIARVTLTGFCPASISGELPAIYDTAASGFEHLVIEDETQPLENYDELARDATSLGAFVRRMNEEIHEAPDDTKRRILERARAVGLAAYREQALVIAGLENGGKGL